MSGLGRRIRRKQLVRATSRDEVLARVAQTVMVHDQILDQVLQALARSGIKLGETTTPSGLVALPPGARLK